MAKEVEPAAPRWRELGKSLGLKGPMLDNIAARNKDDPKVCLRDVIKAWLVGPGGVRNWKRLCKALEEMEGGGGHELAQELASQHLRWDGKLFILLLYVCVRG